MIDWDALVVGPSTGVFGEPVRYWPAIASPVFRTEGYSVMGVFHDAYRLAGQLVETGVTSTRPTLGIRVSDFPPQYDPEQAQGDRFLVVRTGKMYVVREGRTDDHGAARLDAMEAL